MTLNKQGRVSSRNNGHVGRKEDRTGRRSVKSYFLQKRIVKVKRKAGGETFSLSLLPSLKR